MDEFLRLLARRAASENSAAAWQAYAHALERVSGAAQPFADLDEEIAYLDGSVHNILEGLSNRFPAITSSDDDIEGFVWVTHQGAEGPGGPSYHPRASGSIHGWVIIPNAPEEINTLEQWILSVLREYVRTNIDLDYKLDGTEVTVVSISSPRHLRDKQDWVLAEFQFQYE